MRTVMIRSGAAIVAVVLFGLLWLATARRLSELVDGVAAVRLASLSPSPFGWNGTWLQFGAPTGDVGENLVGRMPGIDRQFRSLDLTRPGPSYGSAAELAVDARGRLVLSADGKSFVLAVRTGSHLPVDAGDPEMPEFAAEPGDSASLVIERSWLAWPTPFEINVVGMGGTATTWKRRVCYRLSWVKPSGARLSMVWAGEQPYDAVNLWRAPEAFLETVEIRQAPGSLE
ncbi:MAG: hypothetical protein P4M07_17030 [Xanthobacteraceae bacterium]|nr:hypothetical protein [Xanthobacteraceae bacterium]